MSKYVEFDGDVHLIGAIQGEHTLCGTAMDAADSEHDESLRFQLTKKRTVTCDLCVLEIENCRYVKTKSKTQKPR